MTNGNDFAFGSSRGYKTRGALQGQLEPVTNGLTKREYFAAMAMQGMQSENPTTGLDHETLALCAVAQADALIEALNK